MHILRFFKKQKALLGKNVLRVRCKENVMWENGVGGESGGGCER